MYESFDNRVAVVTGGARGLGAAIGRLLASRGAQVHLLDNDERNLKEAAAAIGPAVHYHVLDVTDEEQILATRDKIVVTSRKVDILINNAGIYPFESIDQITNASWDRVFDINAKSTFFITRAFLGTLKANRYGRVVRIPIYSGRVFRREAGHRSDLKPATIPK